MRPSNSPYSSPSVIARHRGRRLAYWNGLLWSIGNGLCSTTLIVYLAMELHAKEIGLGIGLILAARHFIGVLQLGTPLAIRRGGGRKPFCAVTFGLSGLMLLCLPLLAAPNMLHPEKASLASLVVLWCLHHLMQYVGTIGLYSWIADLVSQPVRGRFFGVRNRWCCIGEAAGALACGLFSAGWQYSHTKHEFWLGYAIPGALGALFILAAIVPILRMPNVDARQSPRIAQTWLRIFEPFGNRAFRWFLIFGCCFSCANGLTQTLQFSYPKAILKEEYLLLFTMLAVQTGMRLGQIGVSPTLGKAADRFGNKRMMIFCLILTAQGPLFYFLATPEHWWWFLGAWVVWIAYAGVNIGLPNWILKIAPSAENAGYLAVFYTCTGLCYGLMTLLNGWLSDRFGKCVWEIADARLDFNHAMFLLGWLARLCCIAVLLLVPERSMHRSERRNSRISDIY